MYPYPRWRPQQFHQMYPYYNNILPFMMDGMNPKGFFPPPQPIQQNPFLPYHSQYPNVPLPFGGQLKPQGNPFIDYFKTKDGTFDLDKMFGTVGKVSTTVKQISPIFKLFQGGK